MNRTEKFQCSNKEGNNSIILECKQIVKKYIFKKKELEVLSGVDLKIKRGTTSIISGRSGAGKSTFLNILGAVDEPTSGKVLFCGKSYSEITKNEMSLIRQEMISIIFQSFNLIESWTALENVEAALVFTKLTRKEYKEKAELMLSKVGLSDRLDFLPHELSIGEQQRIAIARTLVCNPDLILADEPTGNVDPKTGRNIIEHLLEYVRSNGATMILATHGDFLTEIANSIYRLENGVLSKIM